MCHEAGILALRRNKTIDDVERERQEKEREAVKGLNIVELRWRSLFRLALDADREKSRRQTHKDEEEKEEEEEDEEEEDDDEEDAGLVVEGSQSERDPAVTWLGMGPRGVLASSISFSSFSFIVSSSFCCIYVCVCVCLSPSLLSFLFSSSLTYLQILIGHIRSDLLPRFALTTTMGRASRR